MHQSREERLRQRTMLILSEMNQVFWKGNREMPLIMIIMMRRPASPHHKIRGFA
jgi:hypothetical protein